jgi:hypothetical protein
MEKYASMHHSSIRVMMMGVTMRAIFYTTLVLVGISTLPMASFAAQIDLPPAVGGNPPSNRIDVTDPYQSSNPRAPDVGKTTSLSTVSDDNNLATSPGPIGPSMTGDVGLGIEARMPGAEGR